MKYDVKSVGTNDFEMEYLKFGTGEEKFVIIPGLSVKSVISSAATIVKQYEQIAKEFTVYLFDRRKKVPESYSVRDMANDTADAMKTLNLADCGVFGASQGGMIALKIAAENPTLIKKLILGSTCAKVTDRQFETISQWISLAKEKDRVSLYLDFGRKLYPDDFFKKYEPAFKMFAATVTDEELEKFVIIAEGSKDFDATHSLEKIRCPVLLIGSKDDNVLGFEGTEYISENLNNSVDFNILVYDKYGHAAYDLAPDYQEKILSFLKKQV